LHHDCDSAKLAEAATLEQQFLRVPPNSCQVTRADAPWTNFMPRHFMWGLYLFLAILIWLVFRFGHVVSLHAALPDPAAQAAEPILNGTAVLAGARDLAEILEPIRKKFKLPALAAAAVKDGRAVALGAVGVRRAGGNERVELNDRFHIGSNTKSMTATLCALLVEQGKLKWESTIGDVFDDQADKILPAYHAVTLEQLLTHRSGIKDGSGVSAVWRKIWGLSGPMLEQRRKFVELTLAREPAAAPGKKHIYSNYGFTIAGAMCERVTGKSWEELMRELLFIPLEMTTAGFGSPGDAKKVDHPWGHLTDIKWKPVPPGPKADNPAVIGPAGTVHCSLADWAKYAAFHLRGERGAEPRLPAEVFKKLHTPLPDDPDNYAYGWVAMWRPWGGGKVLWHNGSNTMWMAVIWLAPNKDRAYLAATNVGNAKSYPACDAAISKLIELD
jgi:CubicO group peptidase (beta-lactamase class C family)